MMIYEYQSYLLAAMFFVYIPYVPSPSVSHTNDGFIIPLVWAYARLYSWSFQEDRLKAGALACIEERKVNPKGRLELHTLGKLTWSHIYIAKTEYLHNKFILKSNKSHEKLLENHVLCKNLTWISENLSKILNWNYLYCTVCVCIDEGVERIRFYIIGLVQWMVLIGCYGI